MEFIQAKSGRCLAIVVEQTEFTINIPIWRDSNNGHPIGRALLVADPKSKIVTLLDICIYDPGDRNKGAGSDLMRAITNMFDDKEIQTSFFTQAGLNLCLKHGFELKKGMFKGETPILVKYPLIKPTEENVNNKEILE